MLPSQTQNVLSAFHSFVNRANSTDPSITYDKYAAGPLACFSYIQALRFELVTINLVHTNPDPSSKAWPTTWKNSPFSPLWRLWSTCKQRTLTNATDELNGLNPPGRRQLFATTTIKNDAATLAAVHAIYKSSITPLRSRNVKGLVWTLIFQPLLPEWVRKGDANPLGLHDLSEALVIVNFAINWDEGRDDKLVKVTTRRAIEEMEAFARSKGTGNRWRYLNYCAEWQRPFEGYGEENLAFLREVSERFDPEGLFQRACVGGFKLGA